MKFNSLCEFIQYIECLKLSEGWRWGLEGIHTVGWDEMKPISSKCHTSPDRKFVINKQRVISLSRIEWRIFLQFACTSPLEKILSWVVKSHKTETAWLAIKHFIIKRMVQDLNVQYWYLDGWSESLIVKAS